MIFYDCWYKGNNIFCIYKLPKDVNIKTGTIFEARKMVTKATEKLYGVC